jgi:hypothetical protein
MYPANEYLERITQIMATRSNFGSDEEYEAYQDGYLQGATKERHFGTPAPRTRSGGGVLKALQYLATIIVVLGIGYVYFQREGIKITTPTIIIATADTNGLKATPTQRAITNTGSGHSTGTDISPAVPNVQQDINNYNATQTAQYQQPARIDQLPADAPMPQYVEKQAPDRQPAGADNVSPAEPVTDDAHGSKEKEPVNIQETKQCLHGQVWTDSGCHRPTPVK